MTIEQTRVIDLVTRIEETGDARLSISDHLPWTDIHEHLFLIQEKLNAYLQFVESGEFLDTYPDFAMHGIRFHIYFKHSPSPEAERHLIKFAEFVESEADILLSYEVLTEHTD